MVKVPRALNLLSGFPCVIHSLVEYNWRKASLYLVRLTRMLLGEIYSLLACPIAVDLMIAISYRRYINQGGRYH